ncbi:MULTISPECIES: hypothetical protein [unclassified Streptomyces]|uniref:BON domain-containing protein n=1 Tax=Streptomyces sp. NBC_00119 TaxID=2975659 RepID=A0AAU1UIN3_9ACTN|nr:MULTISPECIES: hypothetical protein [unclassified Streptomyces]MCX4647963.1 hypothetical protein [Streptomyces sp. NBC_01446]MCX5320543.1 hypothetical protein [Streptomyces sp. NBC_00120]
MQDMTDLDLYRVTLTTGGAVVMQGAWSNRETGQRKFRSWIGSYGGISEARVVLTERAVDGVEKVLMEWPEA